MVDSHVKNVLNQDLLLWIEVHYVWDGIGFLKFFSNYYLWDRQIIIFQIIIFWIIPDKDFFISRVIFLIIVFWIP